MQHSRQPLEAAFAAPLANGLDRAGEALRVLVNETSKIERTHFLNARPHERTAEPTDHANGFKLGTVMIRVGELTLDIPQARGGGSHPGAPDKGTRTGQVLMRALAGTYPQGVAARKVTGILVKLPGLEVSISPTQVGCFVSDGGPSPRGQRVRLRTANGRERIDHPIKRGTRVPSFFPDNASCRRRVAALRAACDEDRTTGKIHLGMNG